MVPKSDGCSLLKENEPAIESVKVSGTKRPQPECPMNSPHQQTPIRNNGGHLVYVRRKPDSEQHKRSMCNKSKDQTITLTEQDEKSHEQSPMKDSTIHIPKDLPEPKTSSEGVSSAIPSVTIDSGKPNITSPEADSKRRQLDYPKRSSVQHWEERFFLLQKFLKVLEQDDYHQMLHSLSSVDLSRLAVELEKRSNRLALEEVKEVQRAKVLDIQGKPESKK